MMWGGDAIGPIAILRVRCGESPVRGALLQDDRIAFRANLRNGKYHSEIARGKFSKNGVTQ